jgi:hypothetical protein
MSYSGGHSDATGCCQLAVVFANNERRTGHLAEVACE